MKNALYTHSGGTIAPFSPLPEQIVIEDIARGLAYRGRWSGQTRRFYSVAEHCVKVSDQCSDQYQLWGLLHDAGEAFLGDIPAPLKDSVYFRVPDERGVVQRIPYWDIEVQLLHHVLRIAGAAVVTMPEEVDVADLLIREWEYRELVNPETRSASTFVPLGPEAAMDAWLSHYHAIVARDRSIDQGRRMEADDENPKLLAM